MQHSKLTLAIAVASAFFAGFWARGWRDTSSVPTEISENQNQVEPTQPQRRITRVRPALREGEPRQASAKPESADLIEQVASASEQESTAANNPPERWRARSVARYQLALQDFFELYGIDSETANQMVDELVTERQKLTMGWMRRDRLSGDITDAEARARQQSLEAIEETVFAEYYEAYKLYKPKERTHATVADFSAALDEPLSIVMRQQIVDIMYDTELRQVPLTSDPAPTTLRSGFRNADITAMQANLERRVSIDTDVLNQTETLLTRAQQTALEARLARQRERSELFIRMMELQRDDSGPSGP